MSVIWKRAERATVASQKTRCFARLRPRILRRKKRLLGMTVDVRDVRNGDGGEEITFRAR